MKSLAVVMAINVILCGVFALTNGLTCYTCGWDDKQCATELSDANIKTINCTESTTTATSAPAAAGDAPAAADAATTAPAAEAMMSRKLKSNGTSDTYNNKKTFIETVHSDYYCFKVDVKANASAATTVVRGCKLTNSTNDCVTTPVGAIVESCVVCDKDNCNGNGQSIVTGPEVQCALISSLVIAWMFLQTK